MHSKYVDHNCQIIRAKDKTQDILLWSLVSSMHILTGIRVGTLHHKTDRTTSLYLFRNGGENEHLVKLNKLYMEVGNGETRIW